ncbi:hypothetical protein [Congregibacter sp.]
MLSVFLRRDALIRTAASDGDAGVAADASASASEKLAIVVSPSRFGTSVL